MQSCSSEIHCTTYILIYEIDDGTVVMYLVLSWLFADWNTSFDEDTVPQLRQVSCAALACLLKHTGLFNYARSTPRYVLYRYAIYKDLMRSMVLGLRLSVFCHWWAKKY